jgi:hypothetical protein
MIFSQYGRSCAPGDHAFIKTVLSLCVAAATILIAPRVGLTVGAADVVWVGRGVNRILVRIDPLPIGSRASDQMPAEFVIDFKDEISKQLGLKGKFDASSVQVIRYNPDTGQPIRFGKYAYATTEWDCPFRWYDAAIPYNYPDYHRSVVPTDGQIKDWHYAPKWGYLFGTQGDWDSGHLAWVHTQQGNKPSYYAIYFDVLPEGMQPAAIPPAGFVGDGMERREPVGLSTTGMLDSRVALDDWNGDGLFDLVVGSARGTIVYYPNIGNKRQPKFSYAKMVFTTDGKPLDVGISSEPIVVDWDADGVRDLIIGANGNRLLFFKNVGSNAERRFVYKEFVAADGKPIILPHAPVPGSKGVFDDDYHPVPETIDWDGDGDVDLLVGGYVTGMVFYFENVGRSADGIPVLKAHGPLEADGKVLDVEWCAAPTVADFDGDGDLDLITGTLRYTKEGIDPTDNELFLRYFENIGTREKPNLARKPFPKRGEFPRGPLVTPRAVDFNDDGLIDLVVSSNDNVYLYRNVGNKKVPLFEAHANYLPSAWGNAFIADIGSQVVDWNGDGLFDIVTRFSVRLNEGKGWPNTFSKPQPVLPERETISHPAPMGDNYSFTKVADLDGDGRLDILFGDHGGNVYFHKNLSTSKTKHFDVTGVKLMMTNGKPIKVGPAEGAEMNFQVLQGARTTFIAADFNKDGKLDLVVGDTYGKVRYYENQSTPNEMLFSTPVLLGDMQARMAPTAADWNQDGYPDVIGVNANGDMQLFLNQTGKTAAARFTAGTNFVVPAVPYWTAVNIVDWNGDGDEDVMIATDYLYFAFAERSYIEHGYANAHLLAVQKKTTHK